MGTFETMTALVVEPHQLVRRILRDILRVIGIGQTHVVDDVGAGLKLMQDVHVDVVICDWSGATDAVALLRGIRAEDAPNPFVPVIVMSAYSDRDHVKVARDLGAHEYILKPFAPLTVTNHLHALVEHPRLFVRSPVYFGPDRRRHRTLEFPGPERRRSATFIDRRRTEMPFNGADRRRRGKPQAQARMP